MRQHVPEASIRLLLSEARKRRKKERGRRGGGRGRGTGGARGIARETESETSARESGEITDCSCGTSERASERASRRQVPHFFFVSFFLLSLSLSLSLSSRIAVREEAASRRGSQTAPRKNASRIFGLILPVPANPRSLRARREGGRGRGRRQGEISRAWNVAWTVIVSGILGNNSRRACDDASHRGAE